MRPRRQPQLDLRLNAAAPDAAARWHEGASIAYLGGTLRLMLSGEYAEATQVSSALHLPLPPQATPRQIQDCAEAWLRAEAVRHLTALVKEKLCAAVSLNPSLDSGTALAGRRAPRLVLSFAARDHWVEAPDASTLRCHWRLIEQPPAVIDSAISRALASLPQATADHDLFALPSC